MSLVEDNQKSLSEYLEDSLQKGLFSNAVNLINDPKNEEYIRSHAWDLIPMITKRLSQHNQIHFTNCVELLYTIISKSNNEDALLQLIEEIEVAQDDICFITIIKILPVILSRISQYDKRLDNWLGWSCNAIHLYLCKCDLPETETGLVGKEKLLLDNTDEVKRIHNLYKETLAVYKEIVLKLGSHTSDSRRVLTKCCIQLLAKPLGYMDMEVFDDNIKNKSRLLAENIVELIFVNLNTNDLFKLIDVMLFQDVGEYFVPGKFGMAVLMYLVYSEYVFIDNTVLIYDVIYQFQHSLFLVNYLLTKNANNTLIIEKGLKLLNAMLEKVKGLHLTYQFLDSDEHSQLFTVLSKLIVYNSEDSIRKYALKLFEIYLHSFELRGKYLIIKNLLKVVDHSGLSGHIIKMYKDVLFNEFLYNENDLPRYCQGFKLYALLKRFCNLPRNEETDLIQCSDQIISTLNLLRFLTIRDKNNSTKIWDYMSDIQEKYFTYLRKGIDLSKAHYKLKMNEVIEESNLTKKDETEMSVSVSGKIQGMPQMSTVEKMHILHQSMTAFDVIESILTRVEECIESHKSVV